MILSFHPCIVAERQIILGDRLLGPLELPFVHEAEAIILPQGCPYHLYRACRDSSAAVFPNYRTRFEYPGKVGQSYLFKEAGCPFPETIAWDNVEAFRKVLTETGRLPHRLPFVMKTNKSHEGAGVSIVENSVMLESVLDKFALWERTLDAGFVSQEWVPTGGDVLRVVVMGKERLSYWKRSEGRDRGVTTINRGAKIDPHWREDLQEKGRAAAERLCRTVGIDLAAMDYIFKPGHADPTPLILEINYYFGRRGLGGSMHYYRRLFRIVQRWLMEQGLDSSAVTLF